MGKKYVRRHATSKHGIGSMDIRFEAIAPQSPLSLLSLGSRCAE